MGILRDKALEMDWNKKGTRSWEPCQHLLRGTVCLGHCPCHLGPTRLDIHHRLLDALLPQLGIISHCIFASLLEDKSPSSQNMIGQAWVHAPLLSPGAMIGNSCHSLCFIMGSRTSFASYCDITGNQEGYSDAT